MNGSSLTLKHHVDISVFNPGNAFSKSSNIKAWFLRPAQSKCVQYMIALMSTKVVAYKTLVRPKLEYAAPIWSPYCKTQQVEKVQRTAARWTCRRCRNTSSVGEMHDELQWPTLEARRDQFSLLFFHKIQCGIMSIDKDKYLTPSQRKRSTRASHSSKYCRPQTYSDALKCSFSPGLFPIGIVWLQLWSQLRPQRSSGYSFE